jgi:hypothetical protein
MTLIELAIQIKGLLKTGRNFYIRFLPEVLDFTQPDFKGSIEIKSARSSVTIPFDRTSILEIASVLKDSVFGYDTFNVVWDIKNFFSYLKHITRADFEPECQVFDLKIIEGYFGLMNKAPESYAEATSRLGKIFSDPSWASAKSIYQKIYVPLITKVIPAIETNGLIDRKQKTVVHPYYEIEGKNGRMKCPEAYKKHFNPHSLSQEVKDNLYPRQMGDSFIELDFRHMEVTILQWLSKDEGISKILASGEDFYKATFKLLSGGECDSEKKRDLVKKAFLPVIYGMSVDSLSKALEVPFQTADKIVSRERKLFSRSFAWIEEFQNQRGEVRKDHFGRQRFFEDKSYLVPMRNFAVQSPASLVCLEKLIQLHNAIRGYGKIICHVHDGYYICAAKSVLATVCSLAKQTLELESELCVGLKLQCSCKVGDSLTEVKEAN